MRVLVEEELFCHLTELTHCDLGYSDLIISLVGSEEVMLIALVVVEVVVLFCGLNGRLVAEDEIDPVMQLSTDVVGLEGFSHLKDEFFRRARPHRQSHCIHVFPFLLPTQVDAVSVSQELSPVIKLRSQFFHV